MGKKFKRRNKISEIADEIIKESESEIVRTPSIRFDKVISTGSTLLDLSISGKRIRGGGVPGGVLVEIYGPSGSGKTSLLASICASAQKHGGDVKIGDPESRLDQEYIEIYGVSITEEFDYYRPDTVLEMFQDMWKWKPNPERIGIYGVDAVAALSTDLEMDNEEGDKRGQKQAKEFSQNLRKSGRLIGIPNRITIFNNQIRQSDTGEKTPCGMAMEFYASLRIRISQKQPIKKEIKLSSGKVVERVVGIESSCYLKKSTLDSPFRSCPLSIIFGYGLDDIRDQLQWYKDMTKETKYNVLNDKSYQSMDKAIEYIEVNKLQKKLRERTIKLWEEIESKFKIERKPKVFW